ncbi:MAG: hypothetical protein GC137_05865 [Alphaproteobacteria bacterium]|nr:hypothetical protein [Alphaproteobacteria bacterium]
MFERLRKIFIASQPRDKKKEPHPADLLPQNWDQGDTILLCETDWEEFYLYHLRNGEMQGVGGGFDLDYREALLEDLSKKFLNARATLYVNDMRIAGSNATGSTVMPHEDYETRSLMRSWLGEKEMFEKIVRQSIAQTAAKKGHTFMEIDKNHLIIIMDFIADQTKQNPRSPSP